MAWTDTSYEVIDTISDQYYFAGPEWDTQIAKRFILKNKRVSKIVESSYYLHVQHDGSPANIAFEPSASFGCPVGCLFCASGTLFPVRALTATEITEQVTALMNVYKNDFPNIVKIREDVFYCGIGEPTLIADILIAASQQILKNHPHMQFKMSTMGALPSAFSKFAACDVPLRSIQLGVPHWDEIKIKQLYSRCSNYDFHTVLSSVQNFMKIRPETRIKINYVAMCHYNDTAEDLIKTVEKIMPYLDNNFELKISCLNPTNYAYENQLTPISPEQLDQLLLAATAQFNLQKIYKFGPMNHAKLGCGQLAGNYAVGEIKP